MIRSQAAATDLDTLDPINHARPLPTPVELTRQRPLTPILASRIAHQRQVIRNILNGKDDRLLVIAGPCSLHDRESALEYGQRLAALAEQCADQAVLVMRAYVEKPRTTVGWKGLMHDPHLDGSNDMAAGLETARQLMLDLAELGLPIATELLTPMAADYLGDILAWAAVGARTAESQTHRERMSGLGLPVGFKNSTAGAIGPAVDAIAAASQPQHYFGTDAQGRPAAIATAGNPDAHLILRGGHDGPNYEVEQVAAARQSLADKGAPSRLIVDCSHANSGKVAARQAAVMAELIARHRTGESAIAGVMLESHLQHGKQRLGDELAYGVSITDECLGWRDTEATLRQALGLQEDEGSTPRA